MKDSPEHSPPEARSPASGSPQSGCVLIVGARRRMRRLGTVLDQRPWTGLRIVGLVDRSGRGRRLAIHPGAGPLAASGPLDRLSEVIRRSRARHFIVALSERPGREPEARPPAPDLRVHGMAHRPGNPPTAAPVAADAEIPHRTYRPARGIGRPIHVGRVAKRSLDLIASALGLLLLSPLFAAIALLIYATSGRPVFYTQERIGQGGRPFKILKFRSMKPNAESDTGPIWAANHDDRCTPIGDWLRHTCLDELPQLINILKGEMSLVGPRPERPVFVERFTEEIPDYPLRHVVPVGLTGWAQVHGWRGRTSIRKRLQYDLDYVRRWSFWLDVRILFMTALHVALGKVDWGMPRNRRVEREPTDALGRDTLA